MSPILGIIASSYPASTTSYESIATVTLGSSSSTISFTSIPQTFSHLQLRILAQPANTGDSVLNVNGSGGTYTHQLYGQGTSVLAGAVSGVGYIDAGGVSTTYPAAYVIDLLDYTNTNKTKVARVLFGYDANGSGRVGLNSILYNSTSAITSLSITARSWATDSKFALYGIKG